MKDLDGRFKQKVENNREGDEFGFGWVNELFKLLQKLVLGDSLKVEVVQLLNDVIFTLSRLFLGIVIDPDLLAVLQNLDKINVVMFV